MFNKKDSLEKKLQQAESETITSIIDKTMTVRGEVTFKGKTRIDGTINGDITGEHLILSESGKIIGDIKVSSFICHGTIEGNIVANLVTARKGCAIHGRLEATSLSVEPGASLDGEVKAASKAQPPADSGKSAAGTADQGRKS